MWLTNCLGLARTHPWNYGHAASTARRLQYQAAYGLVFATLALGFSFEPVPVRAQQASPGFDPRQTEKRFETPQSGQEQPAGPALRMPLPPRPQAKGDTRPQFVLRGVSLVGMGAIARERAIGTYRPYLGKKVSQADLVAIAGAISDLYRAAGFHLSRAIHPAPGCSGRAHPHSGHRRRRYRRGAEG